MRERRGQQRFRFVVLPALDQDFREVPAEGLHAVVSLAGQLEVQFEGASNTFLRRREFAL